MKHLLVLLFFAVATPVFAQGTGLYQIPACNTGGANMTAPQPSCPSGDVSDTAPYVAPCADKTSSNTTCSIGASAIGIGFSYIGQVANSTFGINGYVMQKSNDKHLLYKVESDVIKLLEDTTFANTEICGNGSPALQRFSPASGINFVNRSLSCGGRTAVQSGASNVAFQYNSGLETNPLGNVPSCTTIHTGNLSGTASQLIYHGPGQCNGQNVDAIVIANVAGAGSGEVFVYCRDKGLCAWYQGIDFTNKQPNTWTSSTNLCNLGPTICKKPATGEFLPNDPLDAPKTLVSKTNPDVSIGSQVTENAPPSFDTSVFEGATFYDSTMPNTKFNQVFQPAVNGGLLLQSSLQRKVQNPSQQEYPPGSPEELGHYDEIYDPGCTESHFVGGKTSSGERYAQEAAQAKTPDTYLDFQANLHNLSSILVPGKKSGLQWQVKQPPIVTKSSDGDKLRLNPQYAMKRFGCGEDTHPKQVAAVAVPVVGSIEAIVQKVTDVVTSLWNLITNQVRECDANQQHCQTYSRNKAILQTTNTATIRTPGMKDIREQSIGNMGAFFAFHPDAIKKLLPRDDGFTNKNQGSGNVLAASTDDANDPNSIPHGGTHAVAKTWQLTSSCMLLPASIQKDRGTNCNPTEGGVAPTPPPSGLACNAANPDNVTTGPGHTYMTDGVIALALKVSKYTCTPAEFIIGLLAGETRGLNYNGTTDTYIKGDPNELVCRTSACVKDQTGDLGPYSWSQYLYVDQFNTWGRLATNCFNALGVSSTAPDARNLGQAMCTTASKFWGSMHDNGNPVGSCSGANQRSYALSEISPDKLELAFQHFCGADKTLCDPFWAKDQNLIKAFSAEVNKVRNEMSCLR